MIRARTELPSAEKNEDAIDKVKEKVELGECRK
jgi:hypothetical protein